MHETKHSSILDRWDAIRASINTCKPARPVTLIAVSKGQTADSILPLLIAGQRDFGENRIQEAFAKWPALKKQYPDIRLHFIGSLQSNKVKEALTLFNVLHTIDRESVVEALIKARREVQDVRCEQFFIQVNTGAESQKGGVLPQNLPELMKYISLPRSSPPVSLPVTGLMCIPPAEDFAAPHFALLRTLADKYALPYLSMGMSGDYESAIRLGATHIRIGTALFGERH